MRQFFKQVAASTLGVGVCIVALLIHDAGTQPAAAALQVAAEPVACPDTFETAYMLCRTDGGGSIEDCTPLLNGDPVALGGSSGEFFAEELSADL